METSAVSDLIIKDHTAYAVAAGALPVPILDIAAVTAVQVDLVQTLARVYQVEFDRALGKSLIVALLGASAAKVGASAAKALPGVGSVGGAVAQVGLAGASTYAVGSIFKSHFEKQGSLADFDPESAKPIYQSMLDGGRLLADKIRGESETRVERKAKLLERLARLRDQNVIDAEEFERLRDEAVSMWPGEEIASDRGA